MMNKYEKWYENTDEYSKLEQYIENIFVKLLNINSINREKWVFHTLKLRILMARHLWMGIPFFQHELPIKRKL